MPYQCQGLLELLLYTCFPDSRSWDPICPYASISAPMVGGVPHTRTRDQAVGARHCLSAEEVTSEGTRQNVCRPPDMAFPEGASDSKQIVQLETVTSEGGNKAGCVSVRAEAAALEMGQPLSLHRQHFG